MQIRVDAPLLTPLKDKARQNFRTPSREANIAIRKHVLGTSVNQRTAKHNRRAK